MHPLWWFVAAGVGAAVDHQKFRPCSRSPACHRFDNFASLPTKSRYAFKSAHINNGVGEFVVQNELNSLELTGRVEVLEASIVRLTFDDPRHPRYALPTNNDILRDDYIATARNKNLKLTDDDASSSFFSSPNVQIKIQKSPFVVSIAVNGTERLSINEQQLLNFERLRESESDTTTVELQADAADVDATSAWSDGFGGKTVTAKEGPQGVGVDIKFLGVQHVYGLSEHAANLSIPTSDEPYRLFNLDVFEYELQSPMALYGSTPLLTGIHPTDSRGSGGVTTVVWLNPSETFVKLADSPTGKSSRWSSEVGRIDLLVLLAATPLESSQMWQRLSGPAPLPPYFSLGRHQCRWNYVDESDVAGVSHNFDKSEIPMDVMWLDIDHSDGRRYFTWDESLFPTPDAMTADLVDRQRKLVVIVDPHIKQDSKYWVWEELNKADAFVKTADGSSFSGWCWPGTSNYPDFFDPSVRHAYQDVYRKWPGGGSSSAVHVWIDMNEPSVFDGAELTMPRNAVHHDVRSTDNKKVEHRDVHNLYGFYYQKTTFEALLALHPNQRPFVLSRSYFLGSQKFGAVWTGDNLASWSHLRASIPMILSQSLSGISFTGADVGGFFGSPDAELLVRWHQLGVWLPFYREHAHLDSTRREPYLWDKSVTDLLRTATRERYRLLPHWYLLFAKFAATGDPIARPIWWDDWDSSDAQLLANENSFFVGEKILVTAVGQPSSSEVSVYIPKNVGGWFDFHSGQKLNVPSGKFSTIAVEIEHVPVFVKAGSAIVTSERVRRSSLAQRRDPLTLNLFLQTDDPNLPAASGELYVDDYETFDYTNGLYAYRKIEATFETPKSLRVRSMKAPLFDVDGKLESSAKFEQFVLIGLPTAIDRCEGSGGVKWSAKDSSVRLKFEDRPGVDFDVTIVLK